MASGVGGGDGVSHNEEHASEIAGDLSRPSALFVYNERLCS